uniref:Uncharacterized protein n=1 Tax=Anguilla anguilla TaxID=7936 RepID=A0A0E9WZW8_ANGAN
MLSLLAVPFCFIAIIIIDKNEWASPKVTALHYANMLTNDMQCMTSFMLFFFIFVIIIIVVTSWSPMEKFFL